MSTATVKWYYDPQIQQVVTLAEDVTASSDWVVLAEHYAQQLIAAQASGGFIYQNTAGTPVVWESPARPLLKWNERATLTHPYVSNGVVNQQWVIDKLSITEQLILLAMRRYALQTSIIVPMCVNRIGTDGKPVVKYIITDQGTWSMMASSATTALMNPNVIFPNWKFGLGDWEPVKGSDLIAAWQLAGELIEICFNQEAAYSHKIAAGQEVDISGWVAPTLADLPGTL